MEDNVLIYLYCIEYNEIAFQCLYERYQLKSKQMLSAILRRFFSIPLEVNDLISSFYFIFLESIFKFQECKNKSFKNFLYKELQWGILAYFKKFLNNNHRIINTALVYNDYLVFSVNEEYEHFSIKDVVLTAKLTKNENQVLQLKQDGYNINEIMDNMNLTYKQVDNAWTRAKIKLKNSYKNYI